ncbi:copper chaperone PCu(A)C [Notoacmeibacter sp. MSK16QG-6]|uniref:copper chaperone PCu(A)C n=1 Tax=Notoacmeibacter sp. MSK16QG-6 TaxID=2957982 RepID=UPI0020A108F4|nr:copper chaperone PCu(A)C [Notoacmeibacter sp. MSK16QG-6]MCP1198935.1 copper chaperone PCu(A)C [Notoacmeibacter sp. MSK16QG-6]
MMKYTIMAAVAALTLLPISAQAESNKMADGHSHMQMVGKLEITDVRLRATPPNAKVAAGYLTVRNTGTEPDRLIGGSVDFADEIEVHEMAVEDGVMKMRPLRDGLEIAPGQQVELKPGSYHLMLMGMKDELKEGQTRTLTVEFEKAGSVSVDAPVAPFGKGGHPDNSKEHKAH